MQQIIFPKLSTHGQPWMFTPSLIQLNGLPHWEGVRIQCRVSALSRLLSPEWLAGDNINILVEGLWRKSASSSVSICFLDTD